MFDPLSNFKLNKILSAVNALPTTLASSFTEVKNAIAGVQNTANTINKTTKSIDTNVDTLVAGRVVKSVQRGTYQAGTSGSKTHFNVNVGISNVNTTKSIVFASGVWKYTNESNAANVGLNLTYTLNSSSINFYGSSNTSQRSDFHGVKIDWQVIEFY